ncbi:aminoacyl-histidine dipeptidase [Capnocytophaga catalasegens]|nr:aminoacyl-histidine dipeptidase [Capnocytophaga catalasegens]
MNSSIRNLTPNEVWNKFADLNQVPRPSKKEEKVIAFILDFGKKLGLETTKDATGNVLIRKPATTGYENRKTIVLQSHLDMVCQKNNDTDFDFDTQGIQMVIDGDWVKAQGTTLGADNGLGVASIMAILESKTIEHPAIEALFTIDEETGMTGAFGLEPNVLTGEILLNLDTEEDDEIDIGCAGGVDVTAQQTFPVKGYKGRAIRIEIKGLRGGHSGMDIHKGFGNANKLLARFLFLGIEKNVRLISIDSGGLRNAIPREGKAVFSVANIDDFINELNVLKTEILNEFSSIESDLSICIQAITIQDKEVSNKDSIKIIQALYAAHNGVFRMSPDVENLVEASNNVARVELKEGKLQVLNLSRSSVESTKWQVANQLKSVFELAGISVEFSGAYPGWKPNPEAKIIKIMEQIYQKNFGEKPHIVACHAGLECGIIGANYPKMEMVSFGPTIKGAHSPDEKVNISSVGKYWKFLLEILKNIPLKDE